MSAKTPAEDAFYDEQIVETDMLGNALLAGFLDEKIAENKKIIANKLNIIGEFSSYKTELDKLQ